MRSRFTLPSLLLLSALSIVAASCAESGEGSGKCTGTKCKDLGTGNNVVEDLSVSKDLTDPNAGHDFSAASDMTRLFVFGEPCSDPLQCADQICVLAGVSGFCSKQCASKADCPSDFDCYAVLGGGIDPTLVVNICIPEANLLCTQCADSTECSATGRDLCLASITGDKFCARDCSTISCPMNYDCKTVSVAGNDYKQCVPKSGACDCNDDLQNNTAECDIDTPLGTICKGAFTCQGSSAGWTACLPPSSTDSLDDFVDNNCDGVDGTLTDAVFVSTSGTDADLCGLTIAMPCRTITFGSQVAYTLDRHNVYVQAGYYDETALMISGVNIVGGFNNVWTRGARTGSGFDVHIRGSYFEDSIENTTEHISVWAHDLTVETTLRDVVVEGMNAISAGKSSYGIHARNALLKLTGVTVVAGNGKAGADGVAGSNASPVGYTTSMDGDTGAAGFSYGGCHTERQAGANAGTNQCEGNTFNASGGNGGASGSIDTECGCVLGNCDARGGLAGADAAVNAGNCGTTGYGCHGGPTGAGSTSDAGSGKNGTSTNGAGGSLGSLGRVLAGYWRPNGGGPGGLGSHGSGGGGGGGSGSNDRGATQEDHQGASGGGGGAGGCRAPVAGTAGGGGGGSFAVFSVDSTLALSDCILQRGIGGAGGKGGDGGQGQAGGPGGPGGDNAGVQVGKGGNGGNGAHGGHSGGGGGGAGGHSVGIFYRNSTLNGTCTATGGAPGAAGQPGLKAADGNAGGTGSAGRSDTDDADSKSFAYQCTNANGC